MSNTRLSKSTGELLYRKYIYLSKQTWYLLNDISRQKDLSESQMLDLIIKNYVSIKDSLSRKELYERTEIQQNV